jgi:integrase
MTLASYIGSLRKIVADISGFSDDRHRYGGSGREAWLAKVHAVPLSKLTPKAIQEWKRRYLFRAAGDPLRQRSARVTLNSLFCHAKGLFSRRIVQHLDLEMPNPLPFSTAQFEPKQNVRYRSGFDVFALLAVAREQLASSDPEGFKILLLALTAGLRAREIDLLEWDAFDFSAGTLSIQPTRYYQPKTEYSLGVIDLEPELVELWRGFKARSNGNFVIESNLPPRTNTKYDYYRCRPHFDRLYAWLRTHGVKNRKPLHTLRKEYGSQVCDRHGIYAASRALRHASVAVTAAHYLDKKSRVTSGLGAAFSDRIVELKQAQTGSA